MVLGLARDIRARVTCTSRPHNGHGMTIIALRILRILWFKVKSQLKLSH